MEKLPCPECIKAWNAVPCAWGESEHELEAYRKHVNEHGKASGPRWHFRASEE